MTTFEIKDHFYLNGKPFKILAGAIHYFRVHPSDWYHVLYNLKAMGFNTVETYVPWNLHEFTEGHFDFTGILDIEKFLSIAQDLGLYAIVRPAPYICAEFEFGGLPAWLLNKPIRIRSSDPEFMQHVESYYDALFPRLVPFQLNHGGNILMFQLENEYGSYGEDKQYLRDLKATMLKRGIEMPLFTADGFWQAALEAGSLIEDNVFVTGNFGSKANIGFASMKHFFEKYNKDWPLMVMEFWDGWFTHWGGEIVVRETEELVNSIREVLELGSICLYMFHGGTTFGFMHGANAYEDNIDRPQVTSYDYGAPLDEAGNPTERYYAIQQLINDLYPEIETKEPLIKEAMSLRGVKLKEKVSLFNTIDAMAPSYKTLYPVPMEKMGQNVGYTLYRSQRKAVAEREKIRIIDGFDRAHIYIDGELIATQYQDSIGDFVEYDIKNESYQIDILMENLGRINYGSKLLALSQNKGVNTGIVVDIHFANHWEQFALETFAIDKIDFTKDWQPNQPAFYLYEFELEAVKDTYIDLSAFGKGIALINGMNIGCYWEVGPIYSLYISHGFLKEGKNQLIIFETEGNYNEYIHLSDKPITEESN